MLDRDDTEGVLQGGWLEPCERLIETEASWFNLAVNLSYGVNMSTEHGYKQAESFPMIARAISSINSATSKWASREQIADYLLGNPQAIDVFVRAFVGKSEVEKKKVLLNAVDWFTAHFTEGNNPFQDEFIRAEDSPTNYWTRAQGDAPQSDLVDPRPGWSGIPSGITSDDVTSALEDLSENGVPDGFGERTDWVVDYGGIWYPPKAVIGIAARRVLGRALKASEFSGGEGPGQANKALRNLGFIVLRRKSVGIKNDPIEAWLDGLHQSRRAKRNGAESPHQPTTVLWLIAQFLKGEPRLQTWTHISKSLGDLINEAGGGATPEYPLAVLANQMLIDVKGIELPIPSTSSNPRRAFSEINPQFGLTEELYEEIGAQPDRIGEIVRSISAMFSSPASSKIVLKKLKLDFGDDDNLPPPSGQNIPSRAPRTASSIQRSEKVAKWIKRTYDDTCQRCGTRLLIPGNATSDAAHIRGLGSPHDGPDVVENVICLCPNHHRTFDLGAWSITDDLKVKDLISGEELGDLIVNNSHVIHVSHIRYHRDLSLRKLNQSPDY
jgi:predicted restriction endonuclease